MDPTMSACQCAHGAAFGFAFPDDTDGEDEGDFPFLPGGGVASLASSSSLGASTSSMESSLAAAQNLHHTAANHLQVMQVRMDRMLEMIARGRPPAVLVEEIGRCLSDLRRLEATLRTSLRTPLDDGLGSRPFTHALVLESVAEAVADCMVAYGCKVVVVFARNLPRSLEMPPGGAAAVQAILGNLLLNACKHGQDHICLGVAYAPQDGEVTVEVSNQPRGSTRLAGAVLGGAGGHLMGRALASFGGRMVAHCCPSLFRVDVHIPMGPAAPPPPWTPPPPSGGCSGTCWEETLQRFQTKISFGAGGGPALFLGPQTVTTALSHRVQALHLARGQPLRVMVAEDNSLCSTLLCKRVRRLFPTSAIVAVASAEDARQVLLDGESFDVALVDENLQSGGELGSSLCSAIRASSPWCVILGTGGGGHNPGAAYDLLLPKPIHASDLRAALHTPHLGLEELGGDVYYAG
jgi:hypothetical protein